MEASRGGLGRLGAFWGRLGASWERLGRGLARLGAILEWFKRRLGRGNGASSAVLGRRHLVGASATRCSYQTEALRLGCHVVLDFYSFQLAFCLAQTCE